MKEWAPEVRRIGFGIGLDPDVDHAIIDGFRCFDGEVLSRFDATASPSNPGSWKVLTKNGFTCAADGVEDPDNLILDMTGSGKSVNEALIPLFDASQTDSPLPTNTRYRMRDAQGEMQTVSWKEAFGAPRYHFELQVGDQLDNKKM